MSASATAARAGYFEFSHIVGLCLLLMGNTKLLPKPYTHLHYPEFLLFLLRSHDRELRNHPWFVTHALRGCIECYIIVEPCDHDRTPQRHMLGMIMHSLLADTQVVGSVRSQYNEDGERKLERLTKMMTSEANVALDLCLTSLSEMHNAEDAIGNTIPQADAAYEQKKRQLRDGVALSKTVLSVFTRLLDQFKQGMAQHLVVQQVGAMLVIFLVRLAGPNSSELKSLSAEVCGFKPRELVGLISEAFVRFHDVPDFCRYCVEGTGNMDAFFDAVRRIQRLDLVPSATMMGLCTMEKKMRDAASAAKEDSSVYTDPPEFACCAVLCDLLTDPVVLPGKGTDDTIVNREAIRHELLDKGANPFTREKLTLAELDEFNARPDVQARIADLKKRIEEWKAAKRRQAVERQAASK